ncbi:MAG: hypothetical protein GY927_23675 [bacterium]|nr:hypothetical protein [bacterium]
MKKFFENTRGNIAVTFAVALVPIVAAAGAAFDYTRLTQNKSIVQEVLDAATMATAVHYQQNGDKNDAESYGKDMFDAQCHLPVCSQVKKPSIKI